MKLYQYLQNTAEDFLDIVHLEQPKTTYIILRCESVIEGINMDNIVN